MKVSDLVRVTHECFAMSIIGWVGIITRITIYDNIYVLFPGGELIFEPIDLEVISEAR